MYAIFSGQYFFLPEWFSLVELLFLKQETENFP